MEEALEKGGETTSIDVVDLTLSKIEISISNTQGGDRISNLSESKVSEDKAEDNITNPLVCGFEWIIYKSSSCKLRWGEIVVANDYL